MNRKRKLLNRAIQEKEQVSRSSRRIQVRCSWKLRKFHIKKNVLESLFNKVAALKVCNSIELRLQRRCFSLKLANFLRTTFLRNRFSDYFWVLTRIFKRVQKKNRCECQQQIPYSAAKKYLLWQKFRRSRCKC